MTRGKSSKPNQPSIELGVSHVERAVAYARAIKAGKIDACHWVERACERQLSDLAESKNKSYPWIFDSTRAERVCRFIEQCPHIKGTLRGQPMRMGAWQSFVVTTVFGWIDRHTKMRRFREAYTEVPGGNGKSAISSPIALYMLAADGEGGAEVYSAATSREQAKIVFETAQHMARAMPEFRERLGVEVLAHSIYQSHTASRFIPLTSDAGTTEGVNIHCAVIDELHKHRTRDVYDVIKNHIGKRAQPLVWTITTAGSDRAGVCYEVRNYVTKILDGVGTIDDRVFGIIYTLDDEDDWADPKNWPKANPNWGVSVFPDAIEAEANQALQVASKQPAFKTKHLDIWVNADHAWMDMQKWKACADKSLKLEDFLRQDCIIGLDLASKLDLLAKVNIFWKDIEGKRHYYIFGTYFTPKKRLELTQNSQYQGWAIDGYLRTCPGETNDYDLVEDDIRADARRFQVLEVGHDPYQAVEMVNHLDRDGIKMIEVAQNPFRLSEPMKEVEAAVYDGRFHHNGDPVLEWAISNVVCHRDKNDNLFPTKERYENKIDPATALFTGMNRVMSPDHGYGTSVYETRGVLEI